MCYGRLCGLLCIPISVLFLLYDALVMDNTQKKNALWSRFVHQLWVQKKNQSQYLEPQANEALPQAEIEIFDISKVDQVFFFFFSNIWQLGIE